MLCAVTNCDGNAVAPRGAFCAAHDGQTTDPTVHALAVLGARVLDGYLTGASLRDVVETHHGGMLVGSDDGPDYRDSQIAATVAALTQTGGSDATE